MSNLDKNNRSPRSKKNRFGFSTEEFANTVSNANTSHLKKYSMFYNITNSLFATQFVALVTAIGIIVLSYKLGFSEIILDKSKFSNNYITIENTGIYYYQSFKEWSDISTLQTNGMNIYGDLLYTFLGLYLAASNINLILRLIMYIPKSWSGAFFYQIYIDKYKSQNNSNVKSIVLLISIIITHILLNVTATLGVIWQIQYEPGIVNSLIHNLSSHQIPQTISYTNPRGYICASIFLVLCVPKAIEAISIKKIRFDAYRAAIMDYFNSCE